MEEWTDREERIEGEDLETPRGRTGAEMKESDLNRKEGGAMAKTKRTA